MSKKQQLESAFSVPAKPIEENSAFKHEAKATKEDNYFKDWDKDRFDEQAKRVLQYYKDPMQVKNYLGRMEPGYHYRWSIVEMPGYQSVVETIHQRRLDMGYTPVVSRESVGDRASGEPSRMGSSTVIREFKNGVKQMLIRIPMQLWELNQKIKAEMASRKTRYDENGMPIISNASSLISEVSRVIDNRSIITREERSEDYRIA